MFQHQLMPLFGHREWLMASHGAPYLFDAAMCKNLLSLRVGTRIYSHSTIQIETFLRGKSMRDIAVFCLALLAATPTSALDLNSFRAQHRLPPLSASSTLAGLAYSHAQDMAGRNHLD